MQTVQAADTPPCAVTCVWTEQIQFPIQLIHSQDKRSSRPVGELKLN